MYIYVSSFLFYVRSMRCFSVCKKERSTKIPQVRLVNVDYFYMNIFKAFNTMYRRAVTIMRVVSASFLASLVVLYWLEVR